ncbi:SDR family NAD(P)-dependent oxidoreductase [Microvirga splendida]|nr:SDR family NAD(P)-dependent oxidoreductase [Microvirga splendida]
MQQTVFVTGGASGIGFAIAEAVLDQGWRAIIADRDERNIDQSRKALARSDRDVHFLQLDIADEAAVVQAVERCEAQIGPVTGLVNAAGIAKDVAALDTSAELFRRILDVNVVGSFVASREIAKRMCERGSGAIVNIASVSGIRGNIGRVAYGASKAGVITMTQVMAVELAASGVRVNAIAPGPVDTPLVREIHTEEIRAQWIERVPQRRYGKPSEIAGMAVFLLDDRKAGFITGQTICIDGGFTAAGLLVSEDKNS